MDHTDMMYQSAVWMDRLMVPGTWVWPVVGVVMVALLNQAIFKLVKQ